MNMVLNTNMNSGHLNDCTRQSTLCQVAFMQEPSGQILNRGSADGVDADSSTIPCHVSTWMQLGRYTSVDIPSFRGKSKCLLAACISQDDLLETS